MRWATRRHCHIDRAACAWLIRRFLDPKAEFVFVDDPGEVPADATPFDMRGVELSHKGGECSFETMATFAGYLVHGVLGATVATAAVFLPVYLFVVVPGKWFRRHERHPHLQGFVKGATAAAAGAIAGAAIVIARQTIGGWLSIAIGLAAITLLLQKRVRAPEPAIVAFAALAGILLHD